jgi:5-methylthioadenosine/S-adenosylhomocysteine deaminase
MSRQIIDLLITARWTIPVIPENTVLEDCALAVNQGKIIGVVPQSEAEKRYQAKEQVVLDNHILIPGLINAHGHAAMSLFKGYADDYPLQTWLEEHIWPAEGKWVSPEFVQDGSELAIAEMIRSGTTCFADMYFFPEETAKAALNTGMRCQLYFPILDFPSAWAQDANDYINKGLALHDNYRSNESITIGFGPHAPYTVSDEPLKRIAVLAEELQAPIQIHLHETTKEVNDAVAESGLRPIDRLNQLGLLSPLTQCVHMTEANNSDIELLSTTGAHVIHCPESNLKLASGFCPVKKLQDAGVNVALGTDGAASNNDLDLLGEMRTASLLAKGVSQDASTLNAHQTLALATINGAKALGQEDKIGSLEIGKAADITAISIDSLEATPLFNPASYLAYSQCSHQVSHVWTNGQMLLKDRQLQTIDEQALREKAQIWAKRIKASGT